MYLIVKSIKHSLQTLKTDLEHKERSVKYLQKHYPHLSDLSEAELIKFFDLKTLDELEDHIKILIEKSCFKETSINHTICSCQDSKGELKALYKSEKEAQKVIAESHMTLSLYQCPYGQGWHITKG